MQAHLRPGILLAAALLLAAPPAQAQILNAEVGGFGTLVTVGDPDYVPLTKAAGINLTVSWTASGTPDDWSDDCVVLDKSATLGVAADDILLTSCGGKAPGWKVVSTDLVLLQQSFRAYNVNNTDGRTFNGQAVGTLTLRTIDLNGDSKLTAGEPIYLTTRPASQATGFAAVDGAGAWTVRLNPAFGFAAGTFVRDGDPEFGSYVNQFRFWPASTSSVVATVAEREDKGWYVMPSASVPAGSLIPVNSLRVGLTTTFTLQPNVIPVGIEVGTEDVEAGKVFPIIVTLANTGAQAGVGLVATKVDKALVDVRLSPLLSPGEQTKVLINLKAPYGGPLEVEVNDLFQVVSAKGERAAGDASAAEIQALQARLAALEAQAATGDVQVASNGAPGLAPLAALGALAAAGALLRRRQA